MANLASRAPKASWHMIATLVRSIFEQADRDSTWAQLGDVVDKLTTAGFCDAALYVLDTTDDILALSVVEHGPRYVPTIPYLPTKKSGAGPTWSGSSPTAKQSPACSVPCS